MPNTTESGCCNEWETQSVAYRRQNPIHQMPQRAVLCSPSYEVQYVLMNPGGQMEAAWLQGASGGEGREQTGSRDSLVLRRLVLSHEHCSPSLQAGVGNRGVPEKAFGAMQTEGPPRDSGHPPLLRPRPTKRKPERRRRLPRAWKSRTGKNVTRPVCPCRTALLAMCKSHAGTAPLHPPPAPIPQVPAAATPGASPARDRTPSHPLRDLPGRSSRRGARRCVPASRGGGRKLPRTKELSANDAGTPG